MDIIYVAAGENVNATNEEGNTPLLIESNNQEEGPEAMEALLKTKAKVQQADDEGFSALYNIIKRGLVRKADALLAVGNFDINETYNNLTPLSYAAMLNNESMFRYLIQKGALAKELKTNNCLRTSLQTAAVHNHLGMVNLLLNAGANPNQRFDIHKQTALIWAVDHNNVAMAKSLIGKGADINAKLGFTSSEYQTEEDAKINDFLFQKTALDLAIKQNHTEMIKLLKERGASKAWSCSMM